MSVVLRAPEWAESFVNGIMESRLHETEISVWEKKVDIDGCYWVEKIKAGSSTDIANGSNSWLAAASLARFGVPMTFHLTAEISNMWFQMSDWVTNVSAAAGAFFFKTHAPFEGNWLAANIYTKDSESGIFRTGVRSTAKMNVEAYEGWDNNEALRTLGVRIGAWGAGALYEKWNGHAFLHALSDVMEAPGDFWRFRDGVGSNIFQWMLANVNEIKEDKLLGILDWLKENQVDLNRKNKLGNNIAHSIAFNGGSRNKVELLLSWCIDNQVDWQAVNVRNKTPIYLIQFNKNLILDDSDFDTMIACLEVRALSRDTIVGNKKAVISL